MGERITNSITLSSEHDLIFMYKCACRCLANVHVCVRECVCICVCVCASLCEPMDGDAAGKKLGWPKKDTTKKC